MSGRRQIGAVTAVLMAALLFVLGMAGGALGQAGGDISLTPASGPPGTEFVATASAPCDTLTVSWDSPPRTFEARNSQTVKGVVPPGAKLGSHTLTATCQRSTGGSQGASGTFTNSGSTVPPNPQNLSVSLMSMDQVDFQVSEVAPTTTRRTPVTTGPVTTVAGAVVAPPGEPGANEPNAAPPSEKPRSGGDGPPGSPETTVRDGHIPGQTVSRTTAKGAPVALWVTGALLLVVAGGVIAVVLVRRRRSVTNIGAPRPTMAAWSSPRTLPQLADALLGEAEVPALATAGPAAARLAEACRGDGVATPLLATMFWEVSARDPRFARVLRQAGASELALRDGRLVVVRHARESRHDLLVLDPGFSGARPEAARLDFVPAVGRVARSLPVDEHTAARAIAEVAEAVEFGVIVAAPPRVLFTHAPSPAWAVTGDGGTGPEATMGTIVETADGVRAVTTALHAVKGHSALTVGGRPARILSAHEPTDSCLLVVDDLALPDNRRGRAGVLRGMSPRQYEPVTFDGIASGAKATTVTAWDLSILAAQQYVGSKVYTAPDTVPGDSGAALVDSSDQMIGFAAFRSAFGEPIEYSAWVWADQVLGAHGARPLDRDPVARRA